MTKPTRLAYIATGLTARAINPLLANDAKINLMPIFAGVTSKNFDAKKLTTSVKAALKGHTIAQDVDIEHVAKMLDHVGESGKADPKSADESVSDPQHKAMEAAAQGQSNLGIPKDVGAEFAEADKSKGSFDAVAEFLKGKGMGDDDIEAVKGMFPQPATDASPDDDDDDEAKKKKAADAAEEGEKKKDEEKKAMDAKLKNMVTPAAMDTAIKAATDQVRKTEREIRAAIATVHPWTGDLAPTLAIDSAADVFRHALKIAKCPDADTLPDGALETVLKLYPKPGEHRHQAHDAAPDLSMDEAMVSEIDKLVPGLARIQQV